MLGAHKDNEKSIACKERLFILYCGSLDFSIAIISGTLVVLSCSMIPIWNSAYQVCLEKKKKMKKIIIVLRVLYWNSRAQKLKYLKTR